MIDWILNQGEKNALKDIINISGKNLNISRLTVCTTPKYQFSKLHYDYVSKYPDSYEIHTEVFRNKGAWCLKLTFKWSRKKQCIYIDKKNPKINVAKVTAAKDRHRLHKSYL